MDKEIREQEDSLTEQSLPCETGSAFNAGRNEENIENIEAETEALAEVEAEVEAVGESVEEAIEETETAEEALDPAEEAVEEATEEENLEENLENIEEKTEELNGNETLLEEEKEVSAKEKKKEKRANIRFYVVLAAMIVAVFGFRFYWNNTFGGVVVDGASMNQTLKSGDKLLMRYMKDADELERGDVIVVYVGDYEECQSISSHYLIKRLIAVEGDKVRCTDGQIEICYAGTSEYLPLVEPYAYYMNQKLYDFSEYEVGEDEIFFLGDNRNNSCDSRYKEAGGSHLGKLYKEDDVYGIVPEWAIENRAWLSKIFFWNSK